MEEPFNQKKLTSSDFVFDVLLDGFSVSLFRSSHTGGVVTFVDFYDLNNFWLDISILFCSVLNVFDITGEFP